MQTSPQGIQFLERHEGVVLRAYRDAAGVWTIGAGLTAASGVVKPKAGMIISVEEATRLLAQALRGNYEPAVTKAMPGAKQHEYDAGISFHFNTGAIDRASWVGKWRLKDMSGVRAAIRLWNKGGGKVLTGLVRRRDEEFALLSIGQYGAVPAPPPGTGTRNARFSPPLSGPEREEIRVALTTLGFAAGSEATQVARAGVLEFQARHGLTVDGIVGPATRATITRAKAARKQAAEAGGLAGAGGAGAALGDLAIGETTVWLIVLPGLIWLAWTAWQYRDALAGTLDRRMPRLAAFLRSF